MTPATILALAYGTFGLAWSVCPSGPRFDRWRGWFLESGLACLLGYVIVGG